MSILITDEIDWLLDPATGDFPLGDITMSRGIAAVLQGARIRLRMVAGEWFRNLDAGVRLFERDGVTAAQALIGQKFSRIKAIREFRRALVGDRALNVAGVPGIIAVPILDASALGRVLSITWQAQTAFGDTPVDRLTVGG